MNSGGSPLMVKLLGICLAVQGMQVQSLVQELRSQVPQHLSPLTPLSSPTPVEILATFLRESQGNCFFLSPAFELKCSSNQSCAQEPLCACSEARDGMKTERQCPGQPGSERHPEGQCPPHPPQPHPQAPTCSGGRHLPLGPSHLTCPRL